MSANDTPEAGLDAVAEGDALLLVHYVSAARGRVVVRATVPLVMVNAGGWGQMTSHHGDAIGSLNAC